MNASEEAEFKRLIGTSTLPELGPDRRAGIREVEDLTEALNRFFRERGISPARQPAIRSAALLWHDHLDESHGISQNLTDSTGSFLHGMMHRREPDYSNAKYWFRRVVQHPAYETIVQRLDKQLNDASPAQDFRDRLLRQGAWDPFGFVDLCEENASRSRDDARYQLLQQIQEIEFGALVAHL